MIPSATAITQSPSATVITRSPSATAIIRSPSATAIIRSPSATVITRSPSATAIIRSPSATAITRSSSATAIIRSPSAISIPRPSSATAITRSSSSAASILRSSCAASIPRSSFATRLTESCDDSTPPASSVRSHASSVLSKMSHIISSKNIVYGSDGLAHQSIFDTNENEFTQEVEKKIKELAERKVIPPITHKKDHLLKRVKDTLWTKLRLKFHRILQYDTFCQYINTRAKSNGHRVLKEAFNPDIFDTGSIPDFLSTFNCQDDGDQGDRPRFRLCLSSQRSIAFSCIADIGLDRHDNTRARFEFLHPALYNSQNRQSASLTGSLSHTSMLAQSIALDLKLSDEVLQTVALQLSNPTSPPLLSLHSTLDAVITTNPSCPENKDVRYHASLELTLASMNEAIDYGLYLVGEHYLKIHNIAPLLLASHEKALPHVHLTKRQNYAIVASMYTKEPTKYEDQATLRFVHALIATSRNASVALNTAYREHQATSRKHPSKIALMLRTKIAHKILCKLNELQSEMAVRVAQTLHGYMTHCVHQFLIDTASGTIPAAPAAETQNNTLQWSEQNLCKFLLPEKHHWDASFLQNTDLDQVPFTLVLCEEQNNTLLITTQHFPTRSKKQYSVPDSLQTPEATTQWIMNHSFSFESLDEKEKQLRYQELQHSLFSVFPEKIKKCNMLFIYIHGGCIMGMPIIKYGMLLQSLKETIESTDAESPDDTDRCDDHLPQQHRLMSPENVRLFTNSALVGFVLPVKYCIYLATTHHIDKSIKTTVASSEPQRIYRPQLNTEYFPFSELAEDLHTVVHPHPTLTTCLTLAYAEKVSHDLDETSLASLERLENQQKTAMVSAFPHDQEHPFRSQETYHDILTSGWTPVQTFVPASTQENFSIYQFSVKEKLEDLAMKTVQRFTRNCVLQTSMNDSQEELHTAMLSCEHYIDYIMCQYFPNTTAIPPEPYERLLTTSVLGLKLALKDISDTDGFLSGAHWLWSTYDYLYNDLCRWHKNLIESLHKILKYAHQTSNFIEDNITYSTVKSQLYRTCNNSQPLLSHPYTAYTLNTTFPLLTRAMPAIGEVLLSHQHSAIQLMNHAFRTQTQQAFVSPESEEYRNNNQRICLFRSSSIQQHLIAAQLSGVFYLFGLDEPNEEKANLSDNLPDTDAAIFTKSFVDNPENDGDNDEDNFEDDFVYSPEGDEDNPENGDLFSPHERTVNHKSSLNKNDTTHSCSSIPESIFEEDSFLEKPSFLPEDSSLAQDITGLAFVGQAAPIWQLLEDTVLETHDELMEHLKSIQNILILWNREICDYIRKPENKDRCFSIAHFSNAILDHIFLIVENYSIFFYPRIDDSRMPPRELQELSQQLKALCQHSETFYKSLERISDDVQHKNLFSTKRSSNTANFLRLQKILELSQSPFA